MRLIDAPIPSVDLSSALIITHQSLFTFHPEATIHSQRLLASIRSAGMRAGLALNPDTPLSAIEPFLGECDIALVMSVMPGFGGQKFERVALEKLAALRGRIRKDQLLEVDGGVNASNARAICDAGADVLVAGTAIFGQPDYGEAVRALRA